jgi:hypothetical protein
MASFSRRGGGARPSGAREAFVWLRRFVPLGRFVPPIFLSLLAVLLGTLGPALAAAASGPRPGPPFVRVAAASVSAAGSVSAVASASAAGSVSAAGSGSAAGSASDKASSNGPAKPPLTMVAETSWVKPGQTFDMTLGVGSTTPASQLGIALTVYGPPEGQSSFDQTQAGDTTGEPFLSDTQTVPLSSLNADQNGDFDLQVGITAGNAQGGSSPLQLNLSCQPLSCNGVYPLRIQLMDTATGSVIGSLITYIVYVESGVSSKLRVALVVPVGTSPSVSSASNGEPAVPTGSSLARLANLVNELSASAAPVTVLPQPQTVQALAAGPAAARSVAAGIASISSDATAQVLNAPYVWVDPEALVDSGFSSQVSQQLRRGAVVLADTHVQASGNVGIIGSDLDTKTLAALNASGVTQVVVPSGDLVSVSGRFAGPSVQTFDLPAGHGQTVEAVQTDPDLQSELSDQQGVGGVLAANQLLADLALVDFEEPYATWNRGVVLAPGLTSTPTPAFLNAFLAGLATLPVVDPVTLSSFFAQVTTGNDGGNSNNGDGWPVSRQLATGSGPVAFPGSALAKAKTRLSALKSIFSAGPVNLTPLSDALLSTQSVLLSSQQQAAALSDFDRLVAQRAAVVSLTAYRTIRLTSQTATIPITLVRRVPYPVTVVLHLSSDKLGFLHDTNPQTVLLTRRSQSVVVDVFARTAGDFPVVVSIRSPTGGLVITSATFTVRSLSASVVAIALTAGAAAVLLVWWARTFVSGRRGKRGRSGAGAHSANHHEEVARATSTALGAEP